VEGEAFDVAAREPLSEVGEPSEWGFPVRLCCSDSDTSPSLGLRTMIVVAHCCLGGGPIASNDQGCPCSDN
jgi:hypothetical protein